MTAPGLTPGVWHPSGPILHNSCSRAIGLSFAMNSSTTFLVKRCWFGTLGRPSTFCKATEPSNRALDRRCMMGWIIEEVVLVESDEIESSNSSMNERKKHTVFPG